MRPANLGFELAKSTDNGLFIFYSEKFIGKEVKPDGTVPML
jgi:hypothetical protein